MARGKKASKVDRGCGGKGGSCKAKKPPVATKTKFAMAKKSGAKIG